MGVASRRNRRGGTAWVTGAAVILLSAPGADLRAQEVEWGAADPVSGQEEVERLQGCFSVAYLFAEDGQRDVFSEDYALDDPILQWNDVERTAENRWTVQNFLVAQDRAMSHFYEEWIYEDGEETWTQKVWGGSPGDDGAELRYACTAPWRMNLWECEAGNAARPIRDTNREDYVRLHRTNKVLVTDEGWIHSQRNEKRTEEGETVAYELGWVTYEGVEDEHCAPAHREGAR